MSNTKPKDLFSLLKSNRPTRIHFGDFKDYVLSINPPKTIRVGTEIVSTSIPFVVLKRKKSWIEEITSPPFFHVAKKIKLHFHWDGIQVLGSNMEKPNCFVFPLPKKEVVANWHLKISCSPSCTPGIKPLYVSVSIYRENVVLTFISLIVKFLAGLSFFSLVLFPFLYYISDTVRMNINNMVFGESSTSYITIAALLLFSIISFSKRFDEIFSTLKEEHDVLVLSETGVKMIDPQGVRVT